MHILQPKHTVLKAQEVDKLLQEFNIVLAQLPKISVNDPALPEGINSGDVVKIERKEETYDRVVI